jgi:hypothetical protein
MNIPSVSLVLADFFFQEAVSEIAINLSDGEILQTRFACESSTDKKLMSSTYQSYFYDFLVRQ